MYDFQREKQRCELLSTADDLPPWSSGSEMIVIVDGNGPLADRELRLCLTTPVVCTWKEEGWNHEYTTSSLCGRGFFYEKNLQRGP